MAVGLGLVWIGVTVAPKFFKSKIKAPINANSANQISVPTPPAPTPLSSAEIAKTTELTSVKVLAKSFTERYGSYSSDSNFENLQSLKSLMTAAMVAYVDKIIADGYPGKEFFGTTTQVVSIAVEQFGEQTSVVRTKTVRQETKSAGTPRVFNQDLVLTLKKSNNVWLVDSARWQ